MIPNGEKRKAKFKGRYHYLEIEKIISIILTNHIKYNVEFCCLNFCHCFRKKDKF